MPDPFVDALADVVGDAHVLRDPDRAAAFETDWTRRFSGRSRCVVRPADTAEVAGVLARCAAAGQPVVPQGGNTGLVGGGVPRGGEVVLSLGRLDRIGPVDRVGGTVEAGAGVTLAALQGAARDAGLEVGLDFAARDSATVGGMIATNAGGLRVLRHGAVRDQLRGIEAVLADGTVVERLSRLRKDSAGYDLPGLLAGSEGTLGVVTRAVWQLVPPLGERVVALLGLASMGDALAVLAQARARVRSLAAAETFGAEELALVQAAHGTGPPLRQPHARYLLLEAAGGDDPTQELAAALDSPLIADVAVGADPPDRARLWAYREGITEAISAQGVPHKLDVAVPLDALADVAARLPEVVAAACPGARVLTFGHLAEGNLHVNVLGPDRDDERVDDAVLRLVAAAGGSISAEHGVGVAKTRWLGLSRRPTDIAAMRAVKAALDPRALLNPGVLLTAQVSAT
jgi:FAD/FMN-containing dehydrogenase